MNHKIFKIFSIMCIHIILFERTKGQAILKPSKNDATCPTVPKNIPYLGFYYGVLSNDTSTWIDEIRTSNLLHISFPMAQPGTLEQVLRQIQATGCSAMIYVGYNLTWVSKTWEENTWNWMLPIVNKYRDVVKALYILDEPFWIYKELCFDKLSMQLCIDRINEICDIIHRSTGNAIPIVTTLAYVTLKAWDDSMYPKLPSGLDWIGMDCYSNDFGNCQGWSMDKYYDWLVKHTSSSQYFTIVPPSWVGSGSSNYAVDPNKIFGVYEKYVQMMQRIGMNRFKLVMPFLWDDRYVSFKGAKNFPLLALWWDIFFSNVDYFGGFNTYLNGFIFMCENVEQCKQVFNPSIATSINLVYGDKIHPIAGDAWKAAGCRGFTSIKVTDKIVQRLKQVKMGEFVTTQSGEMLNFLKDSCVLVFPKFTPPSTKWN